LLIGQRIGSGSGNDDRARRFVPMRKQVEIQALSLLTMRSCGTAGAFSNARDFSVSGGQFVDASYVNELKIDYINNVVSKGEVGACSLPSHS
jgi:hypothetical protein